MDADSVAVLDTEGAAYLVCLKWLERHNKIPGRWGVPRAETYPAFAPFKFRDARSGKVLCAAHIPMGVAGNRRDFTAFASETDIPA